MQIRTRLALQFLLWGGIIMIITSAAIYYSAASYRANDFFLRLNNKGKSTAKLLWDAKDYDPNRVEKIEKDNPVNLHNEKITILNFLDDTVYTSDKKGEIKFRYDLIERVRMHEVIYFKQDDYEVIGTLYEAKMARFVVIAAATDVEGYQFLYKLGIILIVVFFISLLIFSFAGWIYSGRALKPISDVIKDVEDITITKLNQRVSEGNGTDEIGRLAKTFNRMLKRLESSFAMQKNFIANASHELRTPLTAINGQMEVLLMKDRTTDEYKRELSSVMDDIRSLIYLANRLLLIARTSAETPSDLVKKLQIDETLWVSRDELTRFNNKYRINVSVDESITDSGQLMVRCDEFLIKTALSNIMDNACKYSEDHTVNVMIRLSGRWIELLFEDHGIGIPEEELKKVFEPFYRASNALSIRGSGIGLQLVSQIIRNHNGEIEISSVVNKGTTIIIKLPVAG